MPKLSLPPISFPYRLLLGAILFFALTDIYLRILLSTETIVCNRGIGWSIPLSPTLSMLVGLVALSVIASFWWSEENKLKKVGWTLLLVGGSVNLGNRLVEGCVRDYLHLGLFPSFNVADMMLTLGVGVLVFSLTRRQDKQ